MPRTRGRRGGRGRRRADNKDDYTIGYGRPPVETRFKPGKSGNPKGRPKGSKNLSTILVNGMKQTILVIENGRTRRVTTFEAMMRAQQVAALKGNPAAARFLTDNLRAVGALKPLEIDDDPSGKISPEDEAFLAELAEHYSSLPEGRRRAAPKKQKATRKAKPNSSRRNPRTVRDSND